MSRVGDFYSLNETSKNPVNRVSTTATAPVLRATTYRNLSGEPGQAALDSATSALTTTSKSLAIIITDPEPGAAVALNRRARVRMADLGTAHRPAAGIGVAQNQAP